MSINRDAFERILQRHGRYASWAVWTEVDAEERPKAGIGDLSVFDLACHPEALDALNPNVVFLGLNASSRDLHPAPWSNFHDSSPRANDFKIRYALAGTPYYGAYMTDVLVDHHETDSAKVTIRVREEPEWVAGQVARLRDELADLGSSSPLIVAFGGEAYRLASRSLPDHRVVKVPHYANYVSKETYRDQVLTALAAVQPVEIAS